ncbi:Retrovirus-related Pol polyprotein from type-1 retrotransposable element R1 2 [Frankliniella fusca]|uniref:Retrovirus-related Pol polyprotein from type-1 retrotransposable element R1 2 n=1 Tax=Frankliniella fusca TaxID=407009 RepID=A0AAE1HVM4_9NEOP|nr:Retrovirus-related Pol polyprotein from type-1 retrotransposable element R1 2 [Frankliniella fusca]
MILMRNSIEVKYEIINEVKSLAQDCICEISAIKLLLRPKPIVLIAIYRSPSYNSGENWNQFISIINEALLKVDPLVNEIYIIGDFNVNLIEKTNRSLELTDLFEAANLFPIFNDSTRKNLISGKDSAIDNIFSNNLCISSKEIIRNFSLFDHDILKITIERKKQNSKTKYKLGRKLDNANLEALKNVILRESWYEVINESNVNVAYENFISTLNFHLDSVCPVVKSKIAQKKSKKTVWSNEVQYYENLIALAEMSLKLGNVSNQEATHKSIKKFKKNLKKAYDNSVIRANDEIIHKATNISKTTWNIISKAKNELKSKPSLSLKINGEISDDMLKIANEFNTFFLEIPQKIAQSLDPCIFDLSTVVKTESSVFLYDCTPSEIEKHIGTLNNKKSTGVDDVNLEGNIISSKRGIVSEGVPQGSIFGPNMFILYSNCIRLILKASLAEVVLYVDDTTILIPGKSMEEIQSKTTQVLEKVYMFFSSLGLALNLEKTIWLVFNNSKNEVLNLLVKDIPISNSLDVKFLGLHISSKLKWTNQVNAIAKNLRREFKRGL